MRDSFHEQGFGSVLLVGLLSQFHHSKRIGRSHPLPQFSDDQEGGAVLAQIHITGFKTAVAHRATSPKAKLELFRP